MTGSGHPSRRAHIPIRADQCGSDPSRRGVTGVPTDVTGQLCRDGGSGPVSAVVSTGVQAPSWPIPAGRTGSLHFTSGFIFGGHRAERSGAGTDEECHSARPASSRGHDVPVRAVVDASGCFPLVSRSSTTRSTATPVGEHVIAQTPLREKQGLDGNSVRSSPGGAHGSDDRRGVLRCDTSVTCQMTHPGLRTPACCREHGRSGRPGRDRVASPIDQFGRAPDGHPLTSRSR